MSESARLYHERREAMQKVLSDLRKGERIAKHLYETDLYLGKGSRIAPSIDKLRNGYGFRIFGNGSSKKPYELADKNQWPSLIMVTEEIKNAYYKSAHWNKIRQQRYEMDGFSCIQCKDESSILHCHHTNYKNLFNEDVVSDLHTLCETCHKLVHKYSRLKFPSGLPVDYVKQLGFLGIFEDWLLPPNPAHHNPNYKPVQNLIPGFEKLIHVN